MLALFIRLGVLTPRVKPRVTLWLVPQPPPAPAGPQRQPIQFRG
jgi:hypothetical protein